MNDKPVMLAVLEADVPGLARILNTSFPEFEHCGGAIRSVESPEDSDCVFQRLIDLLEKPGLK